MDEFLLQAGYKRGHRFNIPNSLALVEFVFNFIGNRRLTLAWLLVISLHTWRIRTVKARDA